MQLDSENSHDLYMSLRETLEKYQQSRIFHTLHTKPQLCPMAAMRTSFSPCLQFTWHLFTNLLNCFWFISTDCFPEIIKHNQERMISHVLFLNSNMWILVRKFKIQHGNI